MRLLLLALLGAGLSFPQNGGTFYPGDGGGGASGNATSIQGRAVSPTAPQDGQSFVWDSATSQFKPANVTWDQLSGKPSVVNTFNGRSGAVAPQSGDY